MDLAASCKGLFHQHSPIPRTEIIMKRWLIVIISSQIKVQASTSSISASFTQTSFEVVEMSHRRFWNTDGRHSPIVKTNRPNEMGACRFSRSSRCLFSCNASLIFSVSSNDMVEDQRWGPPGASSGCPTRSR